MNNRIMKPVVIIAIAVVLLIIGIFGFNLYDQGYFDKSIQNIPHEIQNIREITKDIGIGTTDEISEKISGVSENTVGQITSKINNIPDLDPQARIVELEKKFKDCSEFDFQKLSMAELLKLSGDQQFEYHETKAEMLTAKIKCGQYNQEIAGQIAHQQNLLEQKWVNSP
jgi:hypothetical protein